MPYSNSSQNLNFINCNNIEQVSSIQNIPTFGSGVSTVNISELLCLTETAIFKSSISKQLSEEEDLKPKINNIICLSNNNNSGINISSCISNIKQQGTNGPRPPENKVQENEKISLSCPKCRRNFRKEKNFLSHIEFCQQKYEEIDEDSIFINNIIGGDITMTTKAGRFKNVKAIKTKTEVVVTSVASGHLLKDEKIEEHYEDQMTIEEEELDGTIFDDDASAENYLEEDIDEFLSSNSCSFCDENFQNKLKLDLHVKKCHPDPDSTVNGTNSKDKKKRNTGQRRQEVLKCTECQRIFNHKNSLVYHMRSHTGERPHTCELCEKSFFATSALKVHMRLHSGEKPYSCEHCGRNFRQWGDLKYHVISIHSDIRQYQCEFCGKDFARKYSLIVHRRIHTGERNYKCEFCGKCFRAASYLQNHRRIHTGEKPHSCPICQKPFRVRSDMKRHMASHNRDHSHSSHTSQFVQTTVIPNNTTTTTNNNQTVPIVTVSSSDHQIILGSTQISQLVRNGQAITTDELGQQTQEITIEETNEEIIFGDIEGTPINISLITRDGRTTTLDAATVATLQQAADLQEGVIYPTREGDVETVTIRDSTMGTLYVWPGFMNDET